MREAAVKNFADGAYRRYPAGGRGTFLCAMPGWRATRWGCASPIREELIAQLLETRLLIEPNVAALAAVRRQEKQLCRDEDPAG